ncbi:MAG: hypothetical protein ACYCV7_13155 [Acidimicrobiales bacterium]
MMVGDSKLVSYANLAAMIKAKVSFIAPASKTYVGADVLAACDFDAAVPVDYVAERDANKAEEDRGSYRVSEDTMVIKAKLTSEPDLHLRRVKGYLRSTIGTDPVTTKPTLECHFDEAALAAEASTDGWYALLTNLGSEVSTADVFRDYKGQVVPERRFKLQRPDSGRSYELVRTTAASRHSSVSSAWRCSSSASSNGPSVWLSVP